MYFFSFNHEVKFCPVLTDAACPRGFARIKGVTCEGGCNAGMEHILKEARPFSVRPLKELVTLLKTLKISVKIAQCNQHGALGKQLQGSHFSSLYSQFIRKSPAFKAQNSWQGSMSGLRFYGQQGRGRLHSWCPGKLVAARWNIFALTKAITHTTGLQIECPHYTGNEATPVFAICNIFILLLAAFPHRC